jgi:hypothetical protein
MIELSCLFTIPWTEPRNLNATNRFVSSDADFRVITNLNQCGTNNRNKQTPWPESVSELDRSSDRRLFAKLVPTFADRGCHVVSATDPYGRILGFLDRKYSTNNRMKVRNSHLQQRAPLKLANRPTYIWVCIRLKNPPLLLVEQWVTFCFIPTSRGTWAGRLNGRYGTIMTRINSFYKSRDLEASVEVVKGYIHIYIHAYIHTYI